MIDAAALKRAAAAKALDFVRPGMTLGLGTGTTAEAFLELLGERVRTGLHITATATSERTAARAAELGIAVVPLDTLKTVDFDIDGADEADRSLNLIKGAGGALLREKIVAAAAKKMIVIADGSKLVRKLGKFPLPVEVTQFAHATTAARIAETGHKLRGRKVPVTLRKTGDAPFVTDGGNYIYDCTFGVIDEPKKLAAQLSAIPGVVGHGLFIGLARILIIARAKGVEVITR